MVDLTARINKMQWENALEVCGKASRLGWLTSWEDSFYAEMLEMYEANGELYEPELKQFEKLKEIAYKNKDSV